MSVVSFLLAADKRSARDIAELAGIDRTALSRIKAGERRPTAAQAVALAEVLGVSAKLVISDIKTPDVIAWLESQAQSALVTPKPGRVEKKKDRAG